MRDEYSDNLRESIARIDERTQTLLKNNHTLAEEIKTHSAAIYKYVDEHYAKKDEFDPIRKLVFGFVGFLLISIGGMFIGTIIKNNPVDVIKELSHPTPPTPVDHENMKPK